MEHQTAETKLALLSERQQKMDEHLKATDAAVKALEDERNHALRWGIITLGAGVMGLISVIWHLLVGNR